MSYLLTQAIELLEEATSYTSCQTWSPSLTDEINSFVVNARAALAATPAQAQQAEALRLGRELFKFDTFNGWVNHAQRAWKAEGVRPEVTICIDAKGRPCRIGRDFMKARDDGAFPVRVYLLRAEDDPAAHGIGASTGGKP